LSLNRNYSCSPRRPEELASRKNDRNRREASVRAAKTERDKHRGDDKQKEYCLGGNQEVELLKRRLPGNPKTASERDKVPSCLVEGEGRKKEDGKKEGIKRNVVTKRSRVVRRLLDRVAARREEQGEDNTRQSGPHKQAGPESLKRGREGAIPGKAHEANPVVWKRRGITGTLRHSFFNEDIWAPTWGKQCQVGDKKWTIREKITFRKGLGINLALPPGAGLRIGHMVPGQSSRCREK